jgi:two-component system sensor histidine kinase KdpD
MTARLSRLANSQTWAGYAAALALTGVVSGVIALVRVFGDVENISMLYLVAVLASAIAFGSGPAIAASVAAFLEFDVLFIEPRYRLTVSDPGEWIALFLLLGVGMVTGQLAAGLRERAREAERREREAVVLYDVVRLLAGPDLASAVAAVAERLRSELALAAVAVDFDKEAPVAMTSEVGDREALHQARASIGAPARVLAEGQRPSAAERGAPGRWIKVVPPKAFGQKGGLGDRLRVVPVSVEGRQVGALVLVRSADAPQLTAADDRLLSAVANQLRLALERVRLRDEATEAEVLRRTDELKSALLGAVSHDLRTPLSAIIASAGSLRQKDVAWSDEERREFAAAIEEEAQRLNRLVGNLLDLSRIEAGSLRPEKGWYDLGALVDDVLGRLRRLTAGHRLAVDVAADLPPVHLDYVEIDAVLSNLIENAVKYTPAGSELLVCARKDNGAVRVEVADNGPGIPRSAIPHLFEPFYRVKGAEFLAQGTGLGLAVASGLVHAHGGRIWAENRAEGGARFVFTLPREEEPAPASGVKEEERAR